MTFCKKSWVVFLTLLLASPAWGWDEVPQPGAGGTGCSQANPRTIANLPSSPEYGTVCFVSNGSATSSNCTSTGSDAKACWYNGSAWVPVGDYALTFKTIDASSGTDPVADTLTDTLVVTGTSPITVTGNSTTDAITIAIADADDDASTKGAATFNNLDFNATSGSVTLSRDETLAGNPALGASDCMWSTTGIICEGATADTIELLIAVADIATTDKTITFPDETGTVCTTGSVCSGYQAGPLTGDVTTSGAAATIANDRILEVMLKAVDAAADEECLTYETTTGDFEWQACGGGSIALNDVDNPTGNKSFAMTSNLLQFTYTNPNPTGSYEGAFEIEATANFGSAAGDQDLVHIHQHTGNPGTMFVVHIAGEDADAFPLKVVGAHSGGLSIQTNDGIETDARVQFASATAASAVCISHDTDRLFHDTDCSETKDVGENFIDGDATVLDAAYLKLDASNGPLTGDLVIGAFGAGIAGPALDVYGSNTTTPVRFTTEGDSTAVDIAHLACRSPTPADGDACDLKFRGHNDDGLGALGDFNYSRIRNVITDTTTGTEDGRLDFAVATSGTLTNVLLMGANSAGTLTASFQSGVNITMTEGVMNLTRSAAATSVTLNVLNSFDATGVDIARFYGTKGATVGANGDYAQLRFGLDDDGGNSTDIAYLRWAMTNVADGSESGELRSLARQSGTVYNITSTGADATDRYLHLYSGAVLRFEGATDNTIETYITVADPTTSDKTITFPDETGTVCTTGSVCTGYLGTTGAGTTYLALDASNDPVTGQLSIVQGAAATTPSLIVQNTTDNAADQVLVIRGPDRGTSANNDYVAIRFEQEDASTTIDLQTEIRSVIMDRSAGLEDSYLQFRAAVNGTVANIMTIGSDSGLGSGLVTVDPDGAGYDFKANADTLNGALCFDGAANGLLHLGSGQSSVARCNGSGLTHGSLTGVGGGSNNGLAIESAADAILVIEADSDNATEADNPEIHLVQDGDLMEAVIGIEGDAGAKYTNSTANTLYLEASVTGAMGGIELATGNRRRMGVTNGGTWTFETDGAGIAVTAAAGSNEECVYIPASVIECQTNAGCNTAALTITTNNGAGGSIPAKLFDHAADDFASVTWKAPNNLTGTTMTVYHHWSDDATCGVVGAREVCWAIDSGTYADGQVYTTAPGGTLVGQVDSCGGAGVDQHYKSPAVTLTHGMTAGEYAVFEIFRDVDGGNCGGTGDDDNGNFLYYLGLEICYPVGDVFSGES